MELNTQTVIRIIIPGLLIYILFFILQCNSWNEIELLIKEKEISISDGWSFIIIIFSGIFYHIIGVRNFLWKPIKKRLQDRVEEELLSPIKNAFDDSTIQNIKNNRKIIYHVFYPLINGDENLKVQARFIFFNGAIVTSIIDLITILCIASFYLLANYLINRTHFYLYLLLIFILAIITSVILLYFSVKRHFKLSKGETDYVVKMKRDTLIEYVNLLITRISTLPNTL